MNIKVLYLPKNFYTSPKKISGYAHASEHQLFHGILYMQYL